mmetsp:Transcript_25353/g.50892  ORF Transcript_25353/g.50892 Transcript_25353/m.50892 type:complete len:251 (-) Transcript_25353:165-917(-)
MRLLRPPRSWSVSDSFVATSRSSSSNTCAVLVASPKSFFSFFARPSLSSSCRTRSSLARSSPDTVRFKSSRDPDASSKAVLVTCSCFSACTSIWLNDSTCSSTSSVCFSSSSRTASTRARHHSADCASSCRTLRSSASYELCCSSSCAVRDLSRFDASAPTSPTVRSMACFVCLASVSELESLRRSSSTSASAFDAAIFHACSPSVFDASCLSRSPTCASYWEARSLVYACSSRSFSSVAGSALAACSSS